LRLAPEASRQPCGQLETEIAELMQRRQRTSRAGPEAAASTRAGWLAALEEIEHQAVHWDTPDHGPTGHLIAQALRAAVEIARDGGLHCEHRQGDKSDWVVTDK
jgi:hypothetical protein